VPPLPLLSVQGDSQTAELIAAHEQTRQALCDAFLLSLDSTWAQIVETAGQRQRELAGILRDREVTDPKLVALVRETLGTGMEFGGVPLDEVLHNACRELQKSEAAREHLRRDRAEARQWARHGYEIGQRHCSWSDHGVAPDWLTEGWPNHFDSCEHLARASEYDMAIGRALQVADELEEADVHGGAYDANQEAARRVRTALHPPSPSVEPREKP
jgi:hypothetical protein